MLDLRTRSYWVLATRALICLNMSVPIEDIPLQQLRTAAGNAFVVPLFPIVSDGNVHIITILFLCPWYFFPKGGEINDKKLNSRCVSTDYHY